MVVTCFHSATRQVLAIHDGEANAKRCWRVEGKIAKSLKKAALLF